MIGTRELEASVIAVQAWMPNVWNFIEILFNFIWSMTNEAYTLYNLA